MPHRPTNLETQMSLFPVAESMEAATNHFRASLPIDNENELHSLLAMYHNTLLRGLNDRTDAHPQGTPV